LKPRRLVLRVEALGDVSRHEAFLREIRGDAFAARWTDALLEWLEHRAALGAQFGTAHEMLPRYRTLGYLGQASILAEFTEGTLVVVRVRFRGVYWSR
jgi:hypothetical protein